jgi:hypothetical protein
MAFNLNIVRPERGPAATDARHRAMGFASLGLGHGVTVGVSFTARSVLPFDIVTGRDDNQDSLVTDARPPYPDVPSSESACRSDN